MKLFVPGKASEESANTPANMAKMGMVLPMPAVSVEVARVQPLVDDADDDEQRAGGDAVVDHHQHGAFDARLVQGEDAQRGKAHVARRWNRRRAS